MPTSTRNYNKTQYEILKSRSLAVSAIKGDGLEKTLTYPAGKVARIDRFPRGRQWGHFFKEIFEQSWGKKSLPLSHSARESEDGVSGRQLARTVSGLSIKPVTDTNLVNIVFTTPDGELSARLANAHAHAYIRQGNRTARARQMKRRRKIYRGRNWYDSRKSCRKSEYALNRYRRDQGIVPGLMSLDGKETVLDPLTRTEQGPGRTPRLREPRDGESQGAAYSQSSVRRAARGPRMLTRCWPTCTRGYDAMSTEICRDGESTTRLSTAGPAPGEKRPGRARNGRGNSSRDRQYGVRLPGGQRARRTGSRRRWTRAEPTRFELDDAAVEALFCSERSIPTATFTTACSSE